MVAITLAMLFTWTGVIAFTSGWYAGRRSAFREMRSLRLPD